MLADRGYGSTHHLGASRRLAQPCNRSVRRHPLKPHGGPQPCPPQPAPFAPARAANCPWRRAWARRGWSAPRPTRIGCGCQLGRQRPGEAARRPPGRGPARSWLQLQRGRTPAPRRAAAGCPARCRRGGGGAACDHPALPERPAAGQARQVLPRCAGEPLGGGWAGPENQGQGASLTGPYPALLARKLSEEMALVRPARKSPANSLQKAQTLLAKSDNPLHHPPKRRCNGSASRARTGSPGPAPSEQTDNADFANSVGAFCKELGAFWNPSLTDKSRASGQVAR